MNNYSFLFLIIEALFLILAVLVFWIYRRHRDKGFYHRISLSDYTLVKYIGKGGMADIFLAKHKRLKAYVAVKILQEKNIEDKYIVRKFLMEGKNIAKINQTFPDSPVVKVLEYGVDKISGRFFIAMEYLQGDNLKNIINSKTHMDLNLKLHIIKEVARALQASHMLKIYHRNISPKNIIIHNKKVTLIDFGIAKEMLSNKLTPTGTFFGTLNYISPEQIMGGQITEKSDIYALGALLYYLIEGKPPFDSPNPYWIMNKHMSLPVPGIKTPVPEKLKQFIYKMLEKRPDKRPDAAEIIDKMNCFLDKSSENV